MTGKQHLTFGIVTGIAFSAYLQKINICQTNADMVYVVCGSIIGNLLLDICFWMHVHIKEFLDWDGFWIRRNRFIYFRKNGKCMLENLEQM